MKTRNPGEGIKLSLPLLVSVSSAAAIAVSMGGYAVFQYLTTPGAAAVDLFVSHLWHVLVLGGAIYLVIWFVQARLLLRPIKRIYLHLYKVSTGRIEPLEMEPRVRELDTMVKGINFLVGRMREGVPEREIEAIKEAATVLHDKAPTETREILDHLARLRETLVVESNVALGGVRGSRLRRGHVGQV